MKKKLRNLIIILFYLTGIPYLRFLYLRKKYGALVRIIAFHEIKDDEVEAFKKKLRFLKKNFNIISPKQFYRGNLSKRKLNILLTFDDGYKGWLKNIVPVLKKESIFAIFFLDERGLDLATELSKMGHEIGGHTVNHLRLPGLSRKELRKEIRRREGFKYFAYPFGDKQSFNRRIIEEIKKTGYEYAFTILPNFNHKKTNRLLMHRDSLNPKMPNILFKAWIYGSYDFIKGFLNIFKRTKIK